MDSLPAECAALVASFLLEERSLAALSASSRFWREVLSSDPALWRSLLARRFGRNAAEEVSCVTDAAPARALFRRLAARRQAVFQAEKVVWLNGSYLEVVPEPTSSFGRAVRLHEVCLLEISARFAGVLPGRYQAAWRCRLQPDFYLDEALLIASQEPAPEGSGEEAAAGAGTQPPAQELGQEGRSSGPGCPARALSQARLTAGDLAVIAEEVGQGWFELLGSPFDVAQLCAVCLEIRGPSGTWKQGLLFDHVRLHRLPPAAVSASPPAAVDASPQAAVGGAKLAGGRSQRLEVATATVRWAPA